MASPFSANATHNTYFGFSCFYSEKQIFYIYIHTYILTYISIHLSLRLTTAKIRENSCDRTHEEYHKVLNLHLTFRP